MAGRADFYPVSLVGEQFTPTQAKVRRRQKVLLAHQFDNPHDPNAIAVFTSSMERLGYVERDSWLHRVILVEEKPVAAEILDIRRGENRRDIVIAATILPRGDAGNCVIEDDPLARYGAGTPTSKASRASAAGRSTAKSSNKGSTLVRLIRTFFS